VFDYKFDWAIVTSGQYFEWLVSGVKVTLELSAVSIALSFVIGLLIAVMRMSNMKPILWFSHAYLEFFRNTPLLVQIFFWYFGSYKILPQGINDWLNARDFEFAAAVIALTIYTSAFIAEDIRSGVRSIPKEQMEAARSSGFSYLRLYHSASGNPDYDSTPDQSVSQPDEKFLPGHDHRCGRTHLSGPPGGKLHV